MSKTNYEQIIKNKNTRDFTDNYKKEIFETRNFVSFVVSGKNHHNESVKIYKSSDKPDNC